MAAGGFLGRAARLARISILRISPQGNNAFLEQLLQVVLGCECLTSHKSACAFTSGTEMSRNL